MPVWKSISMFATNTEVWFYTIVNISMEDLDYEKPETAENYLRLLKAI